MSGNQTGSRTKETSTRWSDKPFLDRFLIILGGISTMILILQGIIEIINLTKQPILTINNHLALPVEVTINGSEFHTYRIEADTSRMITLNSRGDFPARLTWKVIRNKNSEGQEIGELIALTDKNAIRIDMEGEVDITNIVGNKTYFYPKIKNNKDNSCSIYINDGLAIQYYMGVSKPHSNTGITGYYKYASNSNVTLYCYGEISWHGVRNKVSSQEALNVQPQSGITEVSFP